jgi:hypothetical protein
VGTRMITTLLSRSRQKKCMAHGHALYSVTLPRRILG